MYDSAGILFISNNMVLGGYQKNAISGFGGKKELSDKSYIETAIRETLEELFDIIPTSDLITMININIIHKKLIINQNYYMLVYTFEDLELILELLNKNNITSHLYDKFPVTISDLIMKRKQNLNSEISCLCLLPLKQNISINKLFIQDINDYLFHK